MNRRDLLGGSISAGLLAVGAPGWLGAATAPPPNVPVIGLLDAVARRMAPEVNNGLEENGLVYGKDFTFERSGWSGRSSEYQADQLAKYAAKLVERQVALILAFSNRAAVAAKTVTGTTPIVFLADDPMAAGLVDCLMKPGGNLTGIANLDSKLTARRIKIARELVPAADLVVLVTDPTNQPAHGIEIREAQAAAKALHLELSIVAWTGEHSIEIELSALPRDRKAVLVFGGGLPFLVQDATLAYLAVRYGFPAIHGFRQAVEEGGLVSFGNRLADGWRQMGGSAARILRGDRPADLPVAKLTRTELVLNVWPAKSLGLCIPPTLLARADEVIE
jgi:putative ABC transport system substrate-binding protein